MEISFIWRPMLSLVRETLINACEGYTGPYNNRYSGRVAERKKGSEETGDPAKSHLVLSSLTALSMRELFHWSPYVRGNFISQLGRITLRLRNSWIAFIFFLVLLCVEFNKTFNFKLFITKIFKIEC